LARILLVGALAFFAILGAAGIAEAEESRETESKDRNAKLVLGVRWGDADCAKRLDRRTRSLLAVVSYLGDFDCRLSSEALSHARPERLVVDGPFQDTLLNIPVQGNAHVEGALSMVPVPDNQRVVVDVHVDGTVRLAGSGVSHRVQIESDATVTFHAVKRMFLDATGLTCQPASCIAESDMVFKEITAKQQPRLLGKFAERVAQQRVSDSHEAAEEECSEHVVDAICAAFDRELGNSVKIVNLALSDYLASATAENQAQWQRVRFLSADDSISITRDSEVQSQFAEMSALSGASRPPVVLCISRRSFGVGHALAGLQLLQPAVPAGSPAAAPAMPPMRARVSWQKKTVTVTLDHDRSIGLAQEPVIGAGQ
jgi:hypothetical protein